MFLESKDIHDPKRAPFGVLSTHGKRATAEALTSWWKHRSVPADREHIAKRLNELNIEYPLEIALDTLGLSLSDQYWVCPKGLDLSWKSINYFDNPFEGGELGISVSQGGGGEDPWLAGIGLKNPDNTSEGTLSKR